MVGVAAIPRVINASIALLAWSTRKATAGLPDTDTRAIGAAVLGIAAITWVVDTGLSRLGALLTREAAARGEGRSTAVDWGRGRGAVNNNADTSAISTTIVRVAVVIRIVDADLVLVRAWKVGEAAAEGTSFET